MSRKIVNKMNKKLVKELRPICMMATDKFLNGERYIYNDSFNSKVLAVAHVDTVCDIYGLERNFCFDSRNNEIYSIALDDRLGVYTILKALPEYGINLDYLFTTDEEIGRSTAKDFCLENPNIGEKYNWIIEFDRRGIDPVSYIYQNQLPYDVYDMLTGLGIKMKTGSFSDISEMGSLGICGINWGVGYDFEHSYSCVVNAVDYFDTILNFVDFYYEFENTKMPYDYVKPTYNSLSNSKWYSDIWGERSYAEDTKDLNPEKDGYCMDCGTITNKYVKELGRFLCKDCYEYYKDNDWIFDDYDYNNRFTIGKVDEYKKGDL